MTDTLRDKLMVGLTIGGTLIVGGGLIFAALQLPGLAADMISLPQSEYYRMKFYGESGHEAQCNIHYARMENRGFMYLPGSWMSKHFYETNCK